MPSNEFQCSCTLNSGSPCYSAFDKELLRDTRKLYEAMGKRERDIAILAKIESAIGIAKYTQRSKQKQQTERKRTRNRYYYNQRHICRDVFQYLHCLGSAQLTSLNKHFRDKGVEARVHGRTKQLPSNSLSVDDNRRAVDFIINYADVHAITMSNTRLLPTNCSKKTVYAAYKQVSLAADVRVAALRTFGRIWQNRVPFIRTMKPATNLCFTCQKGVTKVAGGANLPDGVKSQAVKELEDHLLKVTKERSYLKSVLESTKRDLPADVQLGVHANCSFEGTSHYSFDFVRQLQFPSNPLQPAPIYFKVPRKCGLFGVHCEPLSRRVNFLIDESVCVGKGADCVISLVHHFFEFYGLGETNVHLHADNCSGPNGNQAMLQYLLWRVLTGRHKSVILTFLISGHTEFSPDGAFSLLKQRYRRTEVNSLSQMADVVTSSSTKNLVQLCGRENGEVLVPSYQWTSFLSQYFNEFEGMEQYQHFRFLPDGSVAALYEAGEEELSPILLLKETVKLPFPDSLPEVKKPKGLDAKRKNYLFKEIRPFVAKAFQDIVTPQPEFEVDCMSLSDCEESDVPPPPKKSKGKGRSGH